MLNLQEEIISNFKTNIYFRFILNNCLLDMLMNKCGDGKNSNSRFVEQ